jgi:hypothetical protein
MGDTGQLLPGEMISVSKDIRRMREWRVGVLIAKTYYSVLMGWGKGGKFSKRAGETLKSSSHESLEQLYKTILDTYSEENDGTQEFAWRSYNSL